MKRIQGIAVLLREAWVTSDRTYSTRRMVARWQERDAFTSFDSYRREINSGDVENIWDNPSLRCS